MKALVLTFCLFCLTLIVPARAQKWTAGLRTGAAQYHFQLNDQFAQGGNLMWYNQLFLGRRLNRHLELEFSLGYNQLHSSQSFPSFNNPGVVEQQSWQTRFLSPALNIKYHFLQLQHWELYGLAGLGSTRVWTTYQTDYFNNALLLPKSEGTEANKWPRLTSIIAGAGANYKLTPRFMLSALFQLTYKADINTYYGATVNQNDFSPALLAGIRYRF